MRRVLLPALAASALCGCANYLGQGIGFPFQSAAYPDAGPPAPGPGGYDPRRDQPLSDWYRNHPVERQAQLMQCSHEPAVTQDTRCMAAIQADRQEASFARAQAQFGDTYDGAPVMVGPIVTPLLK